MTSYVEMKSIEISAIDQPPAQKQANDQARNMDRRSITTNLAIN